jgi:hypothetical protein
MEEEEARRGQDETQSRRQEAQLVLENLRALRHHRLGKEGSNGDPEKGSGP